MNEGSVRFFLGGIFNFLPRNYLQQYNSRIDYSQCTFSSIRIFDLIILVILITQQPNVKSKCFFLYQNKSNKAHKINEGKKRKTNKINQ